ncbi:MAG: Flp pilus assembly protein CpaB [Planctomycetales bacterium]|nr:Flp pilus assembly protein CpaB [Planctomycetales bacterium]
MRPKSMVLILIALGCGLIASIGISQVVDSKSQDDTPKVKTAKILVATIDVDMHEEVTAKQVSLEEWPIDKIPEGALNDVEQLTDRQTRLRIFAGDPITNKKLLEPGVKGSLKSNQIPKGYRVISVKVSMATAVSYLIGPGDRVDILVYKKQRGRARTTTLMKNVTVFAVNSKISREVDEEGQTIHAKTISMLVKPEDVEKLAHAEETGRIRLSLRRPDEEVDEDEPTEGYGEPDEQTSLVSAPLLDPNAANGDPLDFGSAGPAFEMQVMSGGKIQRFHWDDVNDLPNELKKGDAPAAAALPQTTPSGPLPFSIGPESNVEPPAGPEGDDEFEALPPESGPIESDL